MSVIDSPFPVRILYCQFLNGRVIYNTQRFKKDQGNLWHVQRLEIAYVDKVVLATLIVEALHRNYSRVHRNSFLITNLLYFITIEVDKLLLNVLRIKQVAMLGSKK